MEKSVVGTASIHFCPRIHGVHSHEEHRAALIEIEAINMSSSRKTGSLILSAISLRRPMRAIIAVRYISAKVAHGAILCRGCGKTFTGANSLESDLIRSFVFVLPVVILP